MSRESAYQRIKAGMEAEERPKSAVISAYEAYRDGRMTPEHETAFEAAVNNGQIMLPRGGVLKRLPTAPPLPQELIDAYNSHRMTPEHRAIIDSSLASGRVSLPEGAVLQAPKPRTNTELIGMGVRGLMTGAGGLLDLVAGPANALVNAVAGTELSASPVTDLATGAADAMGLARPESDRELLLNAVNEGGVQGLLTAGAALPLRGVQGTTGVVARTLSASPALDTAAGAASAGSAEFARQEGAGPLGQFGAALAGGGVAMGTIAAGRSAARRIGERFGPQAERAVERTPRDVVVDETGNLTEDGQELAARHRIPPEELRAAYDAPPEGAPAAAVAAQADAPVTGTAYTSAPPATPAAARLAAAQAEGIPLTRGQAEQSFAVQDAEQTLLAQASAEGERARQWRAEVQQPAIQAATERFQTAFGDPSLNRTQRGEVVQEAIRELRDLGKAGVNALYRTAERLGGEGLGLNVEPIKRAAREAIIEADVPDQVKNVIRQEMARYGLIGQVERMAEDGLTTVKLDDGRKVQFYGEPRQLTVASAEEFRKAISAQYMADGPRKLSQQVKAAIDDAVEEAIERAARGEGMEGDVAAAYRQAREAHIQQRQTFNAKDVIQQLADFKKGTQTSAVQPERVAQMVFGQGPESLSNLKKVKLVLLSKPTLKSKAAWQALQAQALADIFGQAVSPNGAVSGLRLNSAIRKFGPEKLKVLLGEDHYNRLMQLQRVIGDATIPIAGTTNPSGSGYKLMRFFGPMVTSWVPGLGRVSEIVGALTKQAREVKQAQETLKDITEYTAEKAMRVQEADEKAKGILTRFAEVAREGARRAWEGANIPASTRGYAGTVEREDVEQREPLRIDITGQASDYSPANR